jgi:N-acetylglutamate synthase-like GNAT family acetyltransferase
MKQDKFDVLSAALSAEPKGTFLDRNDPDALRARIDDGHGILEEREGAIVGCAFLVETPVGDVMEKSTLWIAPEHRDGHLSSELYRRRLALLAVRGKTLFTITTSPKVAHLALSHGASEATLTTWEKHVPTQCSCGPCTWVSDEEKPHCARKATHRCRMFVWPKDGAGG